MEKLNLDKKSLKKFGLTMGLCFFVLTVLLLIRHKPSASFTFVFISLLFFLSAAVRPGLLKPVYVFWMRLAFVLGWINTRLILVVVFYLVLTPISIAMRIFKADPLDKKIDKSKNSYWKKKDNTVLTKSNYERQF